MNHERKLFLNEHEDKNEDEQCNSFRSRRGIVMTSSFLSIFLVIAVQFLSYFLGFIRSASKERAKLFNLLYTKGLTTCLCHQYINKKKRV